MRFGTITKMGAVVAAMAVLSVLPAKATLTFTFNNGNAAISSYTGPYGTLDITRVDNNNATVTLTGLGLYSFGDGQTLGLNLAGGGTFYASLVAPNAVVTLGSGAEFFGAVIGSFVELKGDFTMHVDESLATTDLIEPPMPTLVK